MRPKCKPLQGIPMLCSCPVQLHAVRSIPKLFQSRRTPAVRKKLQWTVRTIGLSKSPVCNKNPRGFVKLLSEGLLTCPVVVSSG